jgi:tetratricopeptide (TPR) repeat protein
MRKITFLSLLFLTVSVLGQTQDAILKISEQLIKNKQYLTAFQKLETFDKDNSNPAIVLQKEKILLNYFVSSFMHQLFALKDLKEDETIMDYRGKEGQYTLVSFPINEILDSLIKCYPQNYKLYNGLAEFYYEVHLKYGDNWLKPTSELLKLMEENYLTAIRHNAGDNMSYYVMGYLKVMNKEYKKSTEYFKKSIALKYDNSSAHYNLAYAYWYLNKQDSAITEAEISAKQYEDSIYKADAYRMIGFIYFDKKNMPDAIKYLEKSDSMDRDNYYTLKSLLNLYVKTKDSEKDNKMLMRFYNLAPENPTIYNDLGTIYGEANRIDDLEKFYQSRISEYQDNKKVLGNLYFYLGQLLMETDAEKAKENFRKAKTVFEKIYSKDHQVFKVLDEILNETK